MYAVGAWASLNRGAPTKWWVIISSFTNHSVTENHSFFCFVFRLERVSRFCMPSCDLLSARAFPLDSPRPGGHAVARHPHAAGSSTVSAHKAGTTGPIEGARPTPWCSHDPLQGTAYL